MSEHTATEHHDHDGHGHDGHGGEHVHSHKKQYLILGGILTVVTAVELVILPDVIGEVFSETMLNWILVVLSVFKLMAVLGVFMHLRDDRRIYSIMFISPMIMAVLMIIVLATMISLHWNPYESAYASTARCIEIGECEKPWEPLEESKYQEMYEVAKAEDFSKGKTIYTTNCAACHRGDGGGMVGPAFTDDCYIHGGDLNQIVSILHKGVAAKGMPSWEGVLSNEDMDQVALYVRSMRGTQVKDPKECQGERVQ
jgi:heme/copper-type cytochrome/quinol oxidase subunit 4/cytochrome c551/c552